MLKQKNKTMENQESQIRKFQIEKEIDPKTYFQSEEYNGIFEHFGVQKPRYQRRPVDRAFTVKTDPATNYGMEYDLYYVVTTEREGLQILHKESTSGCLNSIPFAIAVINDFIEGSELWIGPHKYSREQKARDYFAKRGTMVTTL